MRGPCRFGPTLPSLLVLSVALALESCSSGALRPDTTPILARIEEPAGATQFTALRGGGVQEARLAHPIDAAFGVLFAERADKDGKATRRKRPIDAVVAEAIADGPAEVAGVRGGDRITAIDGESIETVADFRRVLGKRFSGDTVRATLARRQEVLDVDVQLDGSRDAVVGVVDRSAFPRHLDTFWTGLEVIELDAATRTRIFGDAVPGLIVTSVIAGAPGYHAGLRAGDRLVSFDGTELTTVDAWRRQLRGLDVGRTVRFHATSSTGSLDGEIRLRLAGRRSFADVPVLFRYAGGIDGTSVHIGSVLFDYETTYRSTRSRDSAKDVDVSWVFGLVRWRRTAKERTLRLFWLLPISF